MPSSSSVDTKFEPEASDTTADNMAAAPAADSAEVTFSVGNRVLSIKSSEQGIRLPWKLVPLQTSCPDELPSWLDFAHQYPDCRTRESMTVQFKSQHQDDLVTNRVAQDTVRSALWTELKKILAPEDRLPRISFYQLKNVTGQPYGVINLTFHSLETFERVHNSFDKIEYERQGCEKGVYTSELLARANTLPGSTFIFDCLALPTQMDVEGLFTALTSMTQNLGSLLGLAKIVTSTKDGSFVDGTGTIRAYLALKGPWLTVPLGELVQQLPSHLLWHGIPHKLLYVGYDLHKTPKYSAHYPLTEGEVAATGTSGGRTSRETTSSEDDDTSSPSKKRKTAGQ